MVGERAQRSPPECAVRSSALNQHDPADDEHGAEDAQRAHGMRREPDPPEVIDQHEATI